MVAERRGVRQPHVPLGRVRLRARLPADRRRQAVAPLDLAAAQRASHPVSEIASSLSLSEGTVRNYLSVAIQKLNAHNRVEAAHIAEQKGWL